LGARKPTGPSLARDFGGASLSASERREISFDVSDTLLRCQIRRLATNERPECRQAWSARLRLVTHRIFKPNPNDPIDFEAAVEATLVDMARRFSVQRILFDPWQMQSTAQRLTKRGLPIREFPQTAGNLTEASQNLYDLIQGRNLLMCEFEDLRLAVSRAVAVETSRGWRIAQEKASHKIDAVVALAIACHAAVSLREPEEPPIVRPYAWSKTSGTISDPCDPIDPVPQQQRPEPSLHLSGAVPAHYLADYQRAREPWRAYVGEARDTFSIRDRWSVPSWW
jgi:hypothetical protein